MCDIWCDVDTALASVPVNMMPLIDATDFKTIEDAVAYNAGGLALFWNFTTTGGVTTVTAVTPTTGGTYDWTDFTTSGMYGIEIPASGGASINNDTEGFGHFTGVATGILPWRGPVIGFRAAGLNDKLIDSAYDTFRALAGTALPGVAAEGAGGLYTRGSGAGQINQQTNGQIDSNLERWLNVAPLALSAQQVQAVVPASTVVASVTGAVGSVTGAVGSVTGNVGGNVVGSVGSVVGAVGSVTGAVGSVTGNVGGNVVGSVGSVVGAVGSVTGAVGSVTGNVGGNVVGSVGSVVGNVGGNVNGSVASVVGNVGGSVASVVGNLGGNVLGGVVGDLGGSVLGNVDGSVNNVVDGVSVGAGGIAANSFAAGAIDAAALAASAGQEIADEILNRNLAGGGSGNTRNVRNALRSLRNRVGIVLGTATIYEEDDATPAWTAAVTTTAGNPISQIDPS